MPTGPPAAIAFDVIETLFSLEPLRAPLVEAGFSSDALEWWFAQTLRDGFALGAMGRFESFPRVAAAVLRTMAARRGLEPSGTWPEAVLGTMSELPAHADAGPALERASASGATVLALTNGAPDVTRRLLERAGLAGHVERVVSIEEVRLWKPRREVYLRAASAASVEPGRLALVAVHAWDLDGAAQVGLRTGWASRLERVCPPWIEPDVTGESLEAVVDALVGG